MGQAELLKKIRAELKSKSLSQFSTALGYRSPSTVFKWLASNKIPNVAKDKVEKYFRKAK